MYGCDTERTRRDPFNPLSHSVQRQLGSIQDLTIQEMIWDIFSFINYKAGTNIYSDSIRKSVEINLISASLDSNISLRAVTLVDGYYSRQDL